MKRFAAIRELVKRARRCLPMRNPLSGRRRSSGRRPLRAMRVKIALAEANREYEERFKRIFIVCASGKTAPEILAILQRRLQNDPETELREAVEQQRQIIELRIKKWLGK